MIHMIAMFAAGGDGTTYNLDGHSITLADSPGPILTQVSINTDGKVYQRKDDDTTDTTTQIDTATDWIIPNSKVTTSYWARATENSQTGGGTLIGTLATWTQLSSTETWSIERQSASGSGTSIWNLTLEIAAGSGGTPLLATGTYILTSTIV